jgi:hypothetical protein
LQAFLFFFFCFSFSLFLFLFLFLSFLSHFLSITSFHFLFSLSFSFAFILSHFLSITSFHYHHHIRVSCMNMIEPKHLLLLFFFTSFKVPQPRLFCCSSCLPFVFISHPQLFAPTSDVCTVCTLRGPVSLRSGVVPCCLSSGPCFQGCPCDM